MKMSGVDWESYYSFMKPRGEWMRAQAHEDVWIRSDGLDECNAAKEVQKAKLPILFIHGDKDTFVPCSMCDELYTSCASQKTKLIVKGAGHCESYYKNTKAFEDALDKFLKGVMR